jgi:hypothetical protein
MADQFDVEATLVGQIQSILYPNGLTAASSIGVTCRVYRGWPLSAALNADLASGVVNISVLPIANSIKPVTSFNEGWIGAAATPSMLAVSFGNEITFSGVPGAGQLVGILVDGLAYVYRSVAGDTLSTVAANLASMISANIAATSTGNTVNILGAIKVVGRTAVNVNLWQEIRRQRQNFTIGFWCPTPQLRDISASLVDLGLAATRFVTLQDGSDGRLIFADTVSQDQNQNANIYRRDLIYSVEYATTMSMTATEMMFGELVVGGTSSYS